MNDHTSSPQDQATGAHRGPAATDYSGPTDAELPFGVGAATAPLPTDVPDGSATATTEAQMPPVAEGDGPSATDPAGPAATDPGYAAADQRTEDFGQRALDMLRRLGQDSAYVLLGFPISLISFTVIITGLSLGVGLAILVGGLFIVAGTLCLGHLFANLERFRLAARGTEIAPVRLPGRQAPLAWLRAVLTNRDLWTESLHAIVSLPVTVLSWSLVLTWWTGLLAGLSYWFWARFLPPNPEDNITLPELLNWSISDEAFYALMGLVFLLTIVPVVSFSARLQASIGVALLSPSKRELSARIDQLSSSRRQVVEAEMQSLRKLERDLHDGPQQRLVRMGMELSLAERKLASDDPEAARVAVAQARVQADETLNELRALSRGIAPPILSDRGIVAALTAVAATSPLPALLSAEFPTTVRFPAAVETSIYFSACEALANAAKHSGGTKAWITLQLTDTALRLEVADDGHGGAIAIPGHGLAGLADRVAGVDGTVDIVSPREGGTVVVVEVPCG